ncbi:Conserved Membrane Protein (Archaea) [Lactococcus lactis subsp. lactis]|nr:Conserved Membrane Protein (Archaea) [Lactococcus lactis subsp. lactis]
MLIFPLIFVSALSIFTEASLVVLILPSLMYSSRKNRKGWILYIGKILLSILFLL